MKRLNTNLLKQNCYVFDSVSTISENPATKAPYTSGEYYDIEERVVPTGVKLIKTKQVNPICPDYVNSFSIGCDYKKDPLASVLTGSAVWATPEQNLLSQLSQKSDEEIREYFVKLFNKLPKQSNPLSQSVNDSGKKTQNNQNDNQNEKKEGDNK